MRNLGMLVLAIWLILTGLLPLLNLNIPNSGPILAILAIAAGVLLLLEGRKVNFSKNLGMLLLSIYLIVTGLLSLLAINIPASGPLLAILAIAAGVLLLIRR